MTIEKVLSFEEMQVFERKSINIDLRSFANIIVSFANSDGGIIAIGISDKTRKILGVDYKLNKLNELLRVPYDYCIPSVKVRIERIPCTDTYGRNNHIVLLHIEPSSVVHTNQADEVFIRVGDKTKKLSFEDRLQLTYDKGERNYEEKIVPDATLNDLDMTLVENYIKRIGYNKTPIEYLVENKNFIRVKDNEFKISTAAILLFGKNPQAYFPRARIRFIKYQGNEEKYGQNLNVIKDVVFDGTILKMLNDSLKFLDTQIIEKTYLGENGLFVKEENFPKFVRQEIIVNAVTHRAYSILGTEIQIKMFDDKLIVESPGKLPGQVSVENIRHTHFSRNPKIAEFLKVHNYVKEYGEGVDRMFTELEKLGYPPLMYETSGFLLRSIINARKPVNAESKPVNAAAKPVNVEPKPVNEAAKSVNEAAKSVNEAAKPVNEAAKPVNVEPKPVNAEPKSVNAEPKPVNAEPKSVNAEPKPVNVESKPVNVESKPVNAEPKPVNVENEFENRIYSLIKTQKNKTQKNILNIYRNFYNIEFDYKDVMETLRCSASASGELLRKLKHLDLIIKTNKSKYKFNNSFNNKNIL